MALFSLNIEMLCPPGSNFYDRFKIAKDSGFDWVEFWGWPDKDIPRIKALCREFGLSLSSFSGDGAVFSLCCAAHMKGYIDYAEKSIRTAAELDCKTIVIHSNALGEGGVVVNSWPELTFAQKSMNCLRTLLALAPIAEKYGVTCVLEPLNARVDHAGNALTTIEQAAHITRLVNSPNIKVLFDMYHMQIEQGNLISTFIEYKDAIGHIHIADNPGRHEPGTGEINYKEIVNMLDREAYKGVTAFELSPATTYEAAVAAIQKLQ